MTSTSMPAVPGREPVVMAVGAPGAGVSALVAALRALDPELGLVEGDLGGGDAPDRPAPDWPGVAGAVLVVDPSAPCGEFEIAAMAELRMRAGVVALVCTRIDAYWEWPRTLRTSRAVLDPFEALPVFAVSATAAGEGAVDESGLRDLRTWIRDVTDADDATRQERRRLGAQTVDLERTIADAAASDSPDGSNATHDGAAVDPGHLRRRLVGDRDRGRADRFAALRVETAAARAESLAEVGAAVIDLQEATRIRRRAASDVEMWRRLLGAECADLARRIDDSTTARLDAAAQVTLVGTGIAAGDLGVREVDPAVARAVERLPAGASGRRQDAEDVVIVVVGVSTGLGIGRLLGAGLTELMATALPGVSGPAAMLVGLLVGVGVAAAVIRARRGATRRTRVIGATADVLAEVRGVLERRVTARVAAAESEVGGLLQRHHERLARSASAAVADLDERIRAGRAPARPDPASEARAAQAREVHARLVTRLREVG